eukprot:Skav223308  [mRNA]  locus=scaffold4198:346847:348382:- [translate_table: standard]
MTFAFVSAALAEPCTHRGAMGAVPSRKSYAARIHPPIERTLTDLTEQMVTAATLPESGGSSSSWKRPSHNQAVHDFAQNPLLHPPTGETWVSGPCVLEIDDYVHLWVSISAGIVHLVSRDGLVDWRVVEMTVESPGASRPSVVLMTNVVYLFYEQTAAGP